MLCPVAKCHTQLVHFKLLVIKFNGLRMRRSLVKLLGWVKSLTKMVKGFLDPQKLLYLHYEAKEVLSKI